MPVLCRKFYSHVKADDRSMPVPIKKSKFTTIHRQTLE
jgi:hypothetical protein